MYIFSKPYSYYKDTSNDYYQYPYSEKTITNLCQFKLNIGYRTLIKRFLHLNFGFDLLDRVTISKVDRKTIRN